MRTVPSRLLLLACSITASLAVSLWWLGARLTDTDRLERVVTVLVADPQVRDVIDDQLSSAIAAGTGADEAAVRKAVSELEPQQVVTLVRRQLDGFGVDVNALSRQLGSGQTSSQAASPPTPALLPAGGMLAALRDAGEWAEKMGLLSLLTGAGAVLTSGRRSKALSRVGMIWTIAGGGVVLVAWAVPRYLQSREGVGAAVARAWFDGGTELGLAQLAVLLGAGCLFVSFATRRV